MTTVSVEEVQARLPALIAALKPGDELIIIQQDRPVARLVAEPPQAHESRRPGSAVGKSSIVEDDDTHLEDFKEYMP